MVVWCWCGGSCGGSCAAAREWRKAAAGQAAAFMEAGGGGLQAETSRPQPAQHNQDQPTQLNTTIHNPATTSTTNNN